MGSWIATVGGGEPQDFPGRLRAVIGVVQRAADSLRDAHRPRHVSMEWAEIDDGGHEVGFHDDDETDVTSWEEVLGCLQRLGGNPDRGVVESMFVEFDTEVELDEGATWIERAGELQIGADRTLDEARVEVGVVYATFVDIWLAENRTTQTLGGRNDALAAKNRPRLHRTLARLATALEASFAAFSSDRYLSQLTDQGFREP
ncbi:MAG: hypothetical protein AAF799_26225 [Myxococcota bacterium]